jgi:Polysaccharide deacetylase
MRRPILPPSGGHLFTAAGATSCGARLQPIECQSPRACILTVVPTLPEVGTRVKKDGSHPLNGAPVKNILSLDFESWVHLYRDAVQQKDFADGKDLAHSDNGYVEMAGEGVIDLLAQHGQKATFFVVSELYDYFPDVFESIADAGHEIVYHTHTYFAHGS